MGDTASTTEMKPIDLTETEVLMLCNQTAIQKEVEENLKCEDVQVRGGIIGPSGAGKSGLINSICCLKGANRAKEGATETTSECTEYVSANGGYIIVDIPGVGTKNVPATTYAQNYNLAEYDFLIIMLISPRLECAENLNDWAITLASTLKKPAFLVYSMFDKFVEEFYTESTQTQEDAPFLRDLPAEKIEKHVEDSYQKMRGQFQKGVYFVGRSLRPKSQSDKAHVFEFDKLISDIADSLSSRKRDVIVQNFVAYSKQWVEKKCQSLKSTMLKMSITSAASGAIPVPGPSAVVDVALLVGFGVKCKEVFCLQDHEIKENFGLEMAQLFIPRVAAILGTIGASVAFTTADDAIKAIPIIGTIVGSVLGLTCSGPVMYVTLVRVRDMFAFLVLEMLRAEATAQANKYLHIKDNSMFSFPLSTIELRSTRWFR